VQPRDSQLTELVRLALSARPCVKWVALASIAVAAATGYWAAQPPSAFYTSEAIALVRHQAPFNSKVSKAEIVIEEPMVLYPEPMKVPDYAFLLTSGGILETVAAAYNGYHNGNPKPLTASGLRGILSVKTEVEIKTSYAVSHYPRLILQVTASTEEMTRELAAVWVNVAAQRMREMAFLPKEMTLASISREFEEERARLKGLRGRLTASCAERAALSAVLDTKNAEAEKSYRTETVRLQRPLQREQEQALAAGGASERDIELEFEMLTMDRELGLNTLTRQSEAEAAALGRERDELEAELDTDIGNQERLVEEFAGVYRQARIALANTMGSFQMVSQPSAPVLHATDAPPRLPLVLAAFAGSFAAFWLCSILWMLLRETAVKVRASGPVQ
jgi:hypothetical protein